jgi:hypothetical protein
VPGPVTGSQSLAWRRPPRAAGPAWGTWNHDHDGRRITGSHGGPPADCGTAGGSVSESGWPPGLPEYSVTSDGRPRSSPPGRAGPAGPGGQGQGRSPLGRPCPGPPAAPLRPALVETRSEPARRAGPTGPCPNSLTVGVTSDRPSGPRAQPLPVPGEPSESAGQAEPRPTVRLPDPPASLRLTMTRTGSRSHGPGLATCPCRCPAKCHWHESCPGPAARRRGHNDSDHRFR